MCTCPDKKYLSGHVHYLPEGVAVATYQRKGPGRAEQRMVYDPRRVPDARAWLEGRLGPLAHFEGAGPDIDPAAISDGTATAELRLLKNNQINSEAAALLTMQKQWPAAASKIDPNRWPTAQNSDASTAASIPSAPSATSEFLDPIKGPTLTVEFPRNTRASVEAFEADDLADYAGGIMPAAVRDQVRDRWRASGLPQDRIARLAGISRPQLANALQGRFGLSIDAADRLRAALAALPPPAQGVLL